MQSFEGRQALIIDDDQSSVRVLEQLLRQVSIIPMVIQDNYTVTQQLEAVDRPDVIFLDLEMPQNNGYKVLELIRNNPKFDGVPTVAYTTHTSHLNQAKRAGFHSFLGKPVDGRQFDQLLGRILNEEHVWEIPG